MNNENNTNNMNNFNNFNNTNNIVGQPVNNNNNNNKKGRISKILIGMVIGFLVCIGGIVVISLTTDIDIPDDYDNSDNYYDDSNKYNNTDNISVDKEIDKILNSANIKSSQILCKAKGKAEVGNVPSGSYAYGDEYICELGDGINNTFLVLSYNNNRVALIMDSNIDYSGVAIKMPTNRIDKIDWISSDDYIKAGGKKEADDNIYVTNEYGPITVNKKLKERTSKWTKLDQSQIVLPTAKQIALASNQDYNTDNLNKNLSGWLCDYSDKGSHAVDNVYGYWTSTPYSRNSAIAVDVNYSGSDCSLTEPSVAYTTQMGGEEGIRPVIIISKDNIDNKLYNENNNNISVEKVYYPCTDETLFLKLQLIDGNILVSGKEKDKIINQKYNTKNAKDFEIFQSMSCEQINVVYIGEDNYLYRVYISYITDWSAEKIEQVSTKKVKKIVSRNNDLSLSVETLDGTTEKYYYFDCFDGGCGLNDFWK